MKVQAGVARMLINISSKIAQIARSRPIPFDVPCKRYEREPFFVSRRNTRGDMASICELHARTHVTYTNTWSERIRLLQKKGIWWREGEREREKRNESRKARTFKRERERDEEAKPGRKPVQFLKPVQSVSYAKSITLYPAIPLSRGALRAPQFSNLPVATR